jgi:hypothetical protein
MFNLLLEATLGDNQMGEQKHHSNSFASLMCVVGFTLQTLAAGLQHHKSVFEAFW